MKTCCLWAGGFERRALGKSFHLGFVFECLESYDADPGNDGYWEKLEEEIDDEALAEKAGKYVEFLIHLIPLEGEAPALELDSIGCLKWHARLLERCPLGLYSEEIESDLI